MIDGHAALDAVTISSSNWSGKATSGGKGLLTFACRDENGLQFDGRNGGPFGGPNNFNTTTLKEHSFRPRAAEGSVLSSRFGLDDVTCSTVFC